MFLERDLHPVLKPIEVDGTIGGSGEEASEEGTTRKKIRRTYACAFMCIDTNRG
jgi:hypothetical protein